MNNIKKEFVKKFCIFCNKKTEHQNNKCLDCYEDYLTEKARHDWEEDMREEKGV